MEREEKKRVMLIEKNIREKIIKVSEKKMKRVKRMIEIEDIVKI